MPSQYRTVDMAPGHSLLLRLRSGEAKPGYVPVHSQSRGKLEVPRERWDAGRAQ